MSRYSHGVLILALAFTGACGREPATPAEVSSRSTRPDADAELAECTNAEAGYSISYPAGWSTSSGEFACRFFDPQPFTVEPNSEGPRTALHVFLGETYEIESTAIFDPKFHETISRETVTVAGQEAIRYEVVSTGEGLEDRGTKSVGYIVKHRGRGLLISTSAMPNGPSDDEIIKVVDQAARSLELQ